MSEEGAGLVEDDLGAALCLPSRFTAANAYGPHTQAALSLLRSAAGMRAQALRAMVEACAGIEVQAWRDAYREVDEGSVEAGFPYRARCLYWEAVAAAATAAGESPADREPTDVLWGAAATRAFAGALSPPTAALMCRPFRASGAVLPD